MEQGLRWKTSERGPGATRYRDGTYVLGGRWKSPHPNKAWYRKVLMHVLYRGHIIALDTVECVKENAGGSCKCVFSASSIRESCNSCRAIPSTCHFAFATAFLVTGALTVFRSNPEPAELVVAPVVAFRGSVGRFCARREDDLIGG